jgi:hypothetical protein
MESKGRRAPRAPVPAAAPVEPVQPIEIQAAAPGPVEPSTEPPEAPELLAETAELADTAVNLANAAGGAASHPSVAAFTPTAEPKPATDRVPVERNPFTALAQSQAALARGLEAMSAEMAVMALSGIDTAARAAKNLLSVKTLSDALVVNAGFTCSNLDTLVGGSAKLSELGVKLAAETVKPILSQLGKGWLPTTRSLS